LSSAIASGALRERHIAGNKRRGVEADICDKSRS
jgi:hypothetical protein